MTEKFEDRLLTRKEAATFLGNLNPQTLAKWASTGKYNLPFSKAGGKTVYWLSDLHEHLNRKLVKHYGGKK